MTLAEYRAIAAKIGGEEGRRIHELIDEVEQLRKAVSCIELPKLLGSKEVAEILEIDPRNMHHKMKTKYFPKPVDYVGGRPLWLEQKIVDYKNNIDIWREREN